MIKTVAIYCRVSTDEQKKFGVSIDDQKNSLTRYCKEHNYKIYDYYLDVGVSAGTISKRKEFVRLLKDLDEIDLILFTRLDRFSRNVRDANNLLAELDKHNTAFKAIDDDDIDVSTADGRFIFNLKVNLAERERKVDSERIRRTNKYKYEVTKTVCTGRAPYGYKISKEKKLIIDEEKSKHILALFNYYLKCNNLNQTTRWFSENFVNRSSRVIRIYLCNTAYIGIFKTTSGLNLYDFCPAIIDEKLFYKVQKLLEKNIKRRQPDSTRKRHNPSPYIFSGLLKCPICGKNLSGKCNTGGSHYYNCKQHEIKKCDNKKCVGEKDIENFLLNNIVESLNKKKLEIHYISMENNKKNIDINSIKSKMNKLTNLYIEDLIDKDYYKHEYEDLKSKLEKAIEMNRPRKIDHKQIKKIDNLLKSDFLSLYSTLDNLEKRRLWASIIDYVVVKDKNNMNIIVY